MRLTSNSSAIRPAGSGSTVVAPPGYGFPVRRATAVDPASLADRLLGRLDEPDVAEAMLLGHSASCRIIAEAAARSPARVAGLVLVGPTTDPRARDWPALAARWLRTAAWERPGQIPSWSATTPTPGSAAWGGPWTRPGSTASTAPSAGRAGRSSSCAGGTTGSRPPTGWRPSPRTPRRAGP